MYTNLRLLWLDLRLKVFRDLALGLVVMLAVLSVRLDGTPGGGIGGAGAREGAGLGFAPQPLVRGSGTSGRRQRRGPGPLGPGADLRRRRQLGLGRQQRTGGRAA